MRNKAGIGTLLRALVHQLDADLDAYYRLQNLPFRARFFPIYRHLSAVEVCPMRELVEICGTSFSAVSQTIGEMVKANLVQCEPGEDKRVKQVRLTPRAQAMRPSLESVWQRVDAVHQELDRAIGVELHAVLLHCHALLEQRPMIQRLQTP
jgi:DNA-binding MarR family transcriptional regulator